MGMNGFRVPPRLAVGRLQIVRETTPPRLIVVVTCLGAFAAAAFVGRPGCPVPLDVGPAFLRRAEDEAVPREILERDREALLLRHGLSRPQSA
jgi:hypothetical protein